MNLMFLVQVYIGVIAEGVGWIRLLSGSCHICYTRWDASMAWFSWKTIWMGIWTLCINFWFLDYLKYYWSDLLECFIPVRFTSRYVLLEYDPKRNMDLNFVKQFLVWSWGIACLAFKLLIVVILVIASLYSQPIFTLCCTCPIYNFWLSPYDSEHLRDDLPIIFMYWHLNFPTPNSIF